MHMTHGCACAVFMLFFIYPSLSATVTSTFNCDNNLGLLRSDYREVCPTPQNFIFWYSIAFFLVYPLGVPLLMYQACVFEGIRPVVEKKCDQAIFRAMLSTFLHQAVPLEMSRFARLVGTCNEEQFEKRLDEAYDELLAMQGGGDHLDTNLLVQHKGNSKMEGLNVEEIVHFMRIYDADGDGIVDRCEFREMLRKSIETADLFTGSETLERVTDKQMEVLLLFDDWKKPGTWSPENGQSLLSLLRRNEAAAMTSEEKAKWYPLLRKKHNQTESEQKDPVRKVSLSWTNGIRRTESKQKEAPCKVRLCLKRPYVRGCDPSEISVHLLEAIVDGLLDTYFTFQLVPWDDDEEGKGFWDHEGRISVDDKEPGNERAERPKDQAGRIPRKASFQDDLHNQPAEGADPQPSHSRKVEVLKSEIAMQTSNPHYDEHFELAINEDADTLLVQAWGRERGGSYDLTGRVLIRVSEIEKEEWEPGVEERRRYVQLLHRRRKLIIVSTRFIDVPDGNRHEFGCFVLTPGHAQTN